MLSFSGSSSSPDTGTRSTDGGSLAMRASFAAGLDHVFLLLSSVCSHRQV